jgi:hypothetical protein
MQYYDVDLDGSIGISIGNDGLSSSQMSAPSNGVQARKLNGAFDILARNMPPR